MIELELTVKFTNVYDGAEHVNTTTIDVEVPSDTDFDDDLDEWSYDNVYPHCGDGNAVNKDAGYFAEILDSPQEPRLVGREFEWA